MFLLSILLVSVLPLFLFQSVIDVRTSTDKAIDSAAITAGTIFTQALKLDERTTGSAHRICISPTVMVPLGGSDGDILVRLSSDKRTLVERKIKGSSQKRDGFLPICLDQIPGGSLVLRVKSLTPDAEKPLSLKRVRDPVFGTLSDQKQGAAMQLRVQYWISPVTTLFGAVTSLWAIVAISGFALFVGLKATLTSRTG